MRDTELQIRGDKKSPRPHPNATAHELQTPSHRATALPKDESLISCISIINTYVIIYIGIFVYLACFMPKFFQNFFFSKNVFNLQKFILKCLSTFCGSLYMPETPPLSGGTSHFWSSPVCRYIYLKCRGQPKLMRDTVHV